MIILVPLSRPLLIPDASKSLGFLIRRFLGNDCDSGTVLRFSSDVEKFSAAHSTKRAVSNVAINKFSTRLQYKLLINSIKQKSQ